MFPKKETSKEVVVHVKPESFKDNMLDKKGERRAVPYRRTRRSEVIRDALAQLDDARQSEDEFNAEDGV